MSREVRMVPKGWEHPSGIDGRFVALYSGSYESDRAEWEKEKLKWDSGDYPDWAADEDNNLSYEEWECSAPDKEDYMPEFPAGDATQFMMYETTTEGTPISPSFDTPEELAKWLVDNKASAFGKSEGSYDGWLRVANGGYAPSAVMSMGRLVSGVDGLLSD